MLLVPAENPGGTYQLEPGGVTCRRISEAQVSQSSPRVKSVINECVPLNDGVHVYL